MKRWWLLPCMLCLLCFAGCAQAVTLPVVGGSVEILPTVIDGETWLFLPTFADADALGLGLSEADGEGMRKGTLADGTAVSVMQSQNLRALFLFSDDPENQGREWVEALKANRTTGAMALVGVDGRVDHADDLRQLRGRGNGTWYKPKRPYQFKLENRADLLQTGLASERARTWVLLAEATDNTLLRNKLAFDVALEMGVEDTSRSEFVDLYYDGDYRGLYLLCEKVEIDPARIDERNYDDLLETWNQSIGQMDLAQLPVGQGINRFGNAYTYIQNVADSGLVDAGAYFLEMESNMTLSDRCWFQLDDQSVIALKNPENPSQAMVEYISERLQEARHTLKNGGVHPETGRTLEDDFDVEAFARLALLNEWAYSLDGYTWSSSFFVLSPGETRFKPGPLWDVELGFAYLSSGENEHGAGLKDQEGWLPDFYRCDAFFQKMRALFYEELYPLVDRILLGDERGTYLWPVEDYAEWIEPSRRMDAHLWETDEDYRLVYAEQSEAVPLLCQFIRERSDWMHQALQDRDHTIPITLNLLYGHAGDIYNWNVRSWTGATTKSFSLELLSPATEDDYAVYVVDAVLSPGIQADRQITVNGQNVHSEKVDGGIHIRFQFEDPSYRPVDYYGEDVGLIYNYDQYIQNYPEVLDLCGDDPEAVMDFFFDEGIYEGHKGNVFFDPVKILSTNRYLLDTLGSDWQNFYWEFLSYGYTDGWLILMNENFAPEVTDLL